MRPCRLLAASALSYPLGEIIAFAAFPAPPGGDVSPAHDPSWLAAHTGPVIAQAYVRSVAALGFLLIAVAISGRARPVAARLIVAGGAGCSLLLLLSQAAVLGATLGVRDGAAAAVTRGAGTSGAALLDLSSLPAVLVFGAGAAALLAGRSARWLGWFTAVGAPIAVLDALSYDGGPFAFFGVVGLAYFLVWSLVCAVTLVLRPLPGAESIGDRPGATSQLVAGRA